MPLSTVLGAQSLIKPGVCTTATRPASPYTGQMIYDTTVATTLVWNGSAWIGGAGKVLQVVQATTSTAVTTTSTSFVTSGLSASITPSSTTSKILITTMQNSKQVTTSTTQLTTLFRGTVAGTNLATGSLTSFGLIAVVSSENYDMIPMQFLDSPNTTSATTYTSGVRVDGGTATINFAGTTSVMTLMEISA